MQSPYRPRCLADKALATPAHGPGRRRGSPGGGPPLRRSLPVLEADCQSLKPNRSAEGALVLALSRATRRKACAPARSKHSDQEAQMAKQPRILAGQTAAITGAARGIGRATAQAFIRQGMRVAIGDVDLATAQATAAELGAGTVALGVDVTDRESFTKFLD